MLDKREPRRAGRDRRSDQSTAGLGIGNGKVRATVAERDRRAARAHLECWSPPSGIDAKSKLYVVLAFCSSRTRRCTRTGLVEGSASALGPALAESAKRALLLCQPFTMLKPEHYDQWKDIEIKFDPHELLGG